MARWKYNHLSFSPKFRIPLATEGCANAALVLNEAVALMEMLELAVVVSSTSTNPSETLGFNYIVPNTLDNNLPSAWRKMQKHVAGFYDIGLAEGPQWIFLPPRAGMVFFANNLLNNVTFNGTNWVAGP